jgi:hypothetical protein
MQSCPKCSKTNIKKNSSYKYYDVYECLSCNYWEYKRIEECCRNPFIIIVQQQSGNRPLYYQCLNCGGCINRTKPLSYKKFANDIEGEFNLDSFDNWKLNRETEGTYLFEQKRTIKIRNSKKYKYDEYLSSIEWKDKCKLVHARENNLCQRCKEKPSAQIHHIHYINLYNEPLEDLQALCGDCHDIETAIQKASTINSA